uniref:Exo-polygalacturonase n=1 Tax=Daucus carota TaxID=4039 RepID=A8CA61_DAUCA|nr:exo-polygalacturonase [Daucus carota]
MGKHSALSVFLFSILVAHSHVSASSQTCDFPAIFNFGDANSDTGAFAAWFFGNPPFFGQSYFNGSAGRVSDGRLLIDFMATDLGLPFLHPYMDSLGANFSHGANFANILSTIALPTSNIIPGVRPPRGLNPVNLDIQVAQFAQFVNRSQTQGEAFANFMPKQEYFSQALYTLDIGQIDITQEFLTNKTDDEIKAVVPGLISSLSSNIQILYSLGGRSFWIHNLGPNGCLPILLTLAPVPDDQLDSAGCAKRYNYLTQYFNSELKKGVDQLRADLPSAAFTYVDVYTAKYSLYQEPAKYGFTHPLETCCGFGGRYNYGEFSLCGSTITVNGTQLTVGPCENPAEYINYEGQTYTQAADQITFNKISTGELSDPPNSLKTACPKLSLPRVSDI